MPVKLFVPPFEDLKKMKQELLLFAQLLMRGILVLMFWTLMRRHLFKY